MCKKEAKDLARSLQQKLNAFGYVCIKESDMDSIAEALNTGFNFVCRDDDVEQSIVETMDTGVQAFRSMQEAKGIKLGHCQEVVAQMGGLNGWNSVAALKLLDVAQPQKPEPMTREQKYLQSHGNHCPCCGSKEISGDSGFDVDGGSGTQEVSCDICNATWDDTYTLSFVDITDEGEKTEFVDVPKFSEIYTSSHVFYKAGDADAPEAIKDRNGEVVLQQCRICGKAEGDLTDPDGDVCLKKFTEAGIIANTYSDDRIVEVEFDATAWFKQASDEEILALAKIDWGGNHEADNVAEFFESSTDVAKMFTYIHLLRDIGKYIGFECDVDATSALDWLKINRKETWARVLCQNNNVKFGVYNSTTTIGQEALAAVLSMGLDESVF